MRLGEELKRNEKERAEHVMLVDLGRNDVGRVATYGTVRVPTYMTLERYSHVMHLVSIVEGRLDDAHDRLDALVACFPAGTVSGAPKVRAMEIIAELENRRRGVYAGAVGYLDFAGQPRFLHHDSHGRDRERPRLRAGGRRHRRRLEPDGGVRGNAGQGARGDARAGTGAGRTVVVAAGLRPASAEEQTMVLVIDNYDSFTYNLVQYLGELGAEVRVRRNDQVTLGEIAEMAPEHIVISPGPGRPEDAGVSVDVIRRFGPTTPILGVCLGHQAIGVVYGGTVCARHRADARQDVDGRARRQGRLRRRRRAVPGRPLSLAGDRGRRLPGGARGGGAHQGRRHHHGACGIASYPVHGVQFHPESVLTDEGRRILRNFLDL